MHRIKLNFTHYYRIREPEVAQWYHQWSEGNLSGLAFLRKRLRPEFQQWLDQQDAEWHLDRVRDCGYQLQAPSAYLCTADSRFAMLFKLTWL